MSVFSRYAFIVYNLVLVLLASMAIAISTGNTDVLNAVNGAFASPQDRVIAGLVAMLLLVLAVVMLIYSLQSQPKPGMFEIESTLAGSITISESALQVIIGRAVKHVEGVKEIETSVSGSPKGLVVRVRTMINPNVNVPEMSKAIQTRITEHIEDITGLTVDYVSVIIDDFSAIRKQGVVRHG